ncbi:MAG: hypothetical protein ACXAC7_08005 [Candidatus Hodarchaeales archaeon]|jgi:hypothetical protein
MQETYCKDRAKDTKILPHEEPPEPVAETTDVKENKKGITTDSLSSGFMRGNVDETLNDVWFNTKIKISNSVAAHIDQALHKANYSTINQLPNTIEKLMEIKGIGEKSAKLILKLKKEKR